MNVQEADALGVSLGNFGETLTAEEAAELMGTAVDIGSGDEEMTGMSELIVKVVLLLHIIFICILTIRWYKCRRNNGTQRGIYMY